ncbi:MAG: hypothetical protein CL763_02735 [Chloroflexi bacterium]|nr:hypothetical protein [Chloroflexota bacterium]MQF86847.1 hypothetical protein [SAR202 cluster bacterium]
MAYQIYFADLSEENKALTLTLLRLKEEAGTIESDEAKLLEELRGSPTPWPQTIVEESTPRSYNRGGPRRNTRRNSSSSRSSRSSTSEN